MKRLKNVFPGYWLVAVTSIMESWGSGVQMRGFGIYLKDLTKAFGWTRAQVSFGASLSRLEGGIEGPFGGIATDKFGPRIVTFAGFVLLGTGLSLMYFVNSLWMFYVVWLVASTGFNLGATGPLDTAMSNWFVKRRGLMVAVGRSAGAALTLGILSLVTWALYGYGWRLAFVILGVGTLFIGLPLSWFFVKPRRPEYYGWLPDGKRVGEEIAADTEVTITKGVEYATEATGEVEFTVRQALKDRIFWIFILGSALHGMVSPVVTVHTIPMLTDRGVDPMLAAVALGTLYLTSIPGRLAIGWLSDRVPITRLKYLVIATYLVQALGLFILTRATSMAGVWVYLVVFGFGYGAGYTVPTPMRGRYWGRKAFATIAGTMAPFMMVAGIIAPVYAGWVYDTTGSYLGVFTVLLICLLIASVVMYFANPPKRPEKITKISDVL